MTEPRTLPRPLARRLLALAAVALLAAPAPAQRGGNSETLRSSPKVLAAFRDVVAKPAQSVVRVYNGDKAVGLGTVVEADGLVLTKASLLGDKPACKLGDGRTVAAKVVGVEDKHDLALLKVDAKGLT